MSMPGMGLRNQAPYRPGMADQVIVAWFNEGNSTY
jgi:hypothetical protein